MTEYRETVGDADDRSRVLDTLADGEPWVFIVASDAPGNNFDLNLEVGGGIPDVRTVRSLLMKTIEALPEG